MSGFNTQNTILGLYYYHDKEKVVCACEDFTDEMYELYEFLNLALSINPDKKIGTDFLDILEVLKNMSDSEILTKFLDILLMLLLEIPIDIMGIGDFCIIRKMA